MATSNSQSLRGRSLSWRTPHRQRDKKPGVGQGSPGAPRALDPSISLLDGLCTWRLRQSFRKTGAPQLGLIPCEFEKSTWRFPKMGVPPKSSKSWDSFSIFYTVYFDIETHGLFLSPISRTPHMFEMIKSFVTSSKPLMFPLPSVIQRRCEVSDPAEGSTHLVPTPPQHGKSTRKRDTQPTTICSTLPMNMAFLWVSSNKYTGVSSREDDIDWHKANTIPIGKQSNKSARRKLGRPKSSRLSCFLITFLTKVPKNGASFSVKTQVTGA